MRVSRHRVWMFVVVATLAGLPQVQADDAPELPRATINGVGAGWIALGESDFENVNCDSDTWTWKDGGVHCKGTPVGVCRTKVKYTNFELVTQWRHLKPAGNSGIFVWAPDSAFVELKPGRLPSGGIEVQVLDNGYAKQYEERTGKPGDWFTTHGDIFPVGTSKLKPFPPLSPDGSRSFPIKQLSKSSPEWNHYYVRAVNGEVRLWVNGEEISGGAGASPNTGFLCLESEGSPVEFKNLKIRTLP